MNSKKQNRNGNEIKGNKTKVGSMTGPAVIVCTAAGLAVGAVHESILLGTAIGAGIGIAIGAGFEQKRKRKV